MSSESVSRFRGSIARSRRATVTAALITGLIVAGCSDSNGTAASTSSASSGGPHSNSAPTTTSQPAGADAAAVQPVLQKLFDDHSRLLAVLSANPSIGDNTSSSELSAFRHVFTEDSPLLAGTLTSLRQDAADGVIEKAGPSGVYHKTLVGPPLPASTADDVTVPVCTYTDVQRVKSATGEVLRSEATVAPGTGEVRRVQGVWRIVGFGPATASDVSHLPPGSPNTCLSVTTQGTP